MLTQIYEVGTPEEAAAISRIGVDHVGVLVGDGRFPRELGLDAARAVQSAVERPAKLSALFLAADLDLIVGIAGALRPDILHLGAASERLAPADVFRLKRELPASLWMRSVPVTGRGSVDLARSYDGLVDFLLLDSHRPGDTQIGAQGVTHDWQISAEIVTTCRTPVILAGGLGPHNVAEAIRRVRPAGVDSKTRTDIGDTHRKDLPLVAAFHRAATATAAGSDG